MIVSELIELLKSLPQDWPITVGGKKFSHDFVISKCSIIGDVPSTYTREEIVISRIR